MIKHVFKESDVPAEILSFVHDIKRANVTGLSLERLMDTAAAVIYACENNMTGAFVECGIESGGNPILAAKIFDYYNKDNKVFLFDTFNGMTAPTDLDVSPVEGLASTTYDSYEQKGEKWCFASLEDVRKNFSLFGVSTDRCTFVVGDVNETLRNVDNLPEEISVLRLDTDWYESTKAEMDFLYPKLVIGGILLLDDYGYWDGSKKAVDDFFENRQEDPKLCFADEQGCSHIKVR